MRDVLSYSISPMLLGNNKCSRRLARRLFWRFGVRSCIFDVKGSRELDLMISASFSPLPATYDDEFMILCFEKFALEMDDLTFMIVPCTRDAEDLLQRNSHRLEKRFIIRTPSDIDRAIRLRSKTPYAKKGIS